MCANACAFNALTSSQTTGNKGDMVALKSQTVSEKVPQLIVAGEVDDSGRYCHNPIQTHTCSKYGVQMGTCWGWTARHKAGNIISYNI